MRGIDAFDVKVLDIKERKDGDRAGKRFRVRWSVRGRRFERDFPTKGQADGFRTKLSVAVATGDVFSPDTGLPRSYELAQVTVAAQCKLWVISKVTSWSGKTRESNIVPLAEMLILLTAPKAPKAPDSAVKDISQWLLEKDATCPAWLLKYSLPIADCTPSVCLDAMNALSHTMDGKGGRTSTLKAPNTINRYRRACRQFFEDAVTRQLLQVNPWPTASRGKKTSKETASTVVRVDLLPTLDEVVEILAKMDTGKPSAKHYQVICSLVFYAGLRPSEARALRIEHCKLPREGWGSAQVSTAAKLGGRFLLNDQIVGASKTNARTVPLAPNLVKFIREHIGSRKDGLIFPSKNDTPIDLSRIDGAWRRARGENTWRLYDLRHAHATIGLRAGVPAVEMARRLGHSVDVLHKVYEGAMPGDLAAGNALLEKAFD